MQETWIPTERKAKLKAFVYGAQHKTALIVCHGFTGNSSGIFFPELSKQLSKDYLVCRFDFAGQGKSEGLFYDTSITSELNDLDSVVRYIKDQYSPQKVVLIGHSFGAAIASLYAQDHQIDGLVLLSGEGDLEKAMDYEFSTKQREEFATKGETKVVNWSKDGKEELLGKKFLEDMTQYSTIVAATKLKCPSLLIHGDQDKEIPPSASEEIYAAIPSKKTLKIIHSADHVYNFFSDKPLIEEVTRELQSWLMQLSNEK